MLAFMIFVAHFSIVSLQYLKSLLFFLTARQVVSFFIEQVFAVVGIGVEGILVVHQFERLGLQVVPLSTVDAYLLKPSPCYLAQSLLDVLFRWRNGLLFGFGLEESANEAISHFVDIALYLVLVFPFVL